MSILDSINSVNDVKKLDINQKKELAEEIREHIVDVVSKKGGHLASNLGVVELTIALFSIYNLPEDKIIWDVGHQCYTHKILSGRKDKLNTLRSFGGISGFPKTNESIYDSFNTGHSSTSISVALGMANANRLQNKVGKVIAVIGDGALTGGMAMEALNDAGSSKANLVVILNDNGMSISKNIGGISNLLTIMRLKKTYNVSNNFIKRWLNKIPVVGTGIVRVAHKIKKSIKQLFIPNMYFEDIGFTYLGPVDGHDIEKLEKILNKSKNIEGPVIIHAVTKKGKGYRPAEENSDIFHGVSSFDKDTGSITKKLAKDYSYVFGNKIVNMASKNDRIVAVSASMKDGTGLTEFEKKYPERFFDVGIAEQHALGMIAGMAKSGMKPIFAVYSSFLQRGYDQLIHDIAIQNLPVTICIDRAGVVGNDGETHQGLFDMAYLSQIPNFTVMAPKNFKELEYMLEFAVNHEGPISIRYPRGNEECHVEEDNNKIIYGKSEIIKQGEDLTIFAIGKMVRRAYEIANRLREKGIDVEVINARFIKPLDEETLINSITKTKKLVSMEDGILNGGIATSILKCINKNHLEQVRFKAFGYEDVFVEQGNVEELEKHYGLDEESLLNEILQFINK